MPSCVVCVFKINNVFVWYDGISLYDRGLKDRIHSGCRCDSKRSCTELCGYLHEMVLRSHILVSYMVKDNDLWEGNRPFVISMNESRTWSLFRSDFLSL